MHYKSANQLTGLFALRAFAFTNVTTLYIYTEQLLEAAIESWPVRDLNPRPYSVHTTEFHECVLYEELDK